MQDESTPNVTVLMPVYNASSFLVQAVESILNQTFCDYEFLIIDDGSTDGSHALLQDFAEQDQRVRLMSRENRGIVTTLNEGLALARGEWLVRMDADDVAMPDRLEKQLAYVKSHPACVCVGTSMRTIDEEGDPFMRDKNGGMTHVQIDAKHAIGHTVLCHPTVMYQVAAVRQVGGYDSKFEYAEDLELYLRLAEVGELAKLPDVLLDYRWHGGNVSSERATEQALRMWQAAHAAAMRRGLPFELPAPARCSSKDDPLSNGRFIAGRAAKNGYPKTAAKWLRRVWRAQPLAIQHWPAYGKILWRIFSIKPTDANRFS